jgi:hypothetical protein
MGRMLDEMTQDREGLRGQVEHPIATPGALVLRFDADRWALGDGHQRPSPIPE